MLATPKKLLLVPALRTARQYHARTAAGGAEGLHWYLCPAQQAFHHLVLLDGPVLLAHWVQPAVPGLSAATTLLASLWTHVPPALGLAVPDATQATARGTCQAVATSRQAFAVAPGRLPTSQLLLKAAGTPWLYGLRQLRPGGQGWLLAKLPNSQQPRAATQTRRAACKPSK